LKLGRGGGSRKKGKGRGSEKGHVMKNRDREPDGSRFGTREGKRRRRWGGKWLVHVFIDRLSR